MKDIDDQVLRGLFPDSPDGAEEPEEKPHHGIVHPSEFRNWGYKYVRFADGRVLFCDNTDSGMSHKRIVESYDKAPPFSAGQIKVKNKRWAITDSGSETAKLPRMGSDEKFIAKELGPEFEYDIEVSYW